MHEHAISSIGNCWSMSTRLGRCCLAVKQRVSAACARAATARKDTPSSSLSSKLLLRRLPRDHSSRTVGSMPAFLLTQDDSSCLHDHLTAWATQPTPHTTSSYLRR